MTETRPNAPEGARYARAQRVFEAMIGGAGVEAISAQEKLTQKRVEAIVREALGRRWVLSLAEFARLQIARLDALSVQALKRAQAGELKAIDRALKILDRLDRYHGFDRASPALEQYGEEERDRLHNKINTIAARLKELKEDAAAE
jgi:hypothetical protein